MTSLAKGGNAPVASASPVVSVRWRASNPAVSEVDVSAFLLRADGKVPSDAGMVFYGQPEGPGGSVKLQHVPSLGGGAEARFNVGLGLLPPDIERVAFTGTVGNDASFQLVDAVEVVVGDGADAVRFDVPLQGSTEAALVLGELYRRNGAWKFRAVAQGFNGGLAPLARSFGVDIAADAPALPAPAPPPPVSLSKVTLSKAKPSVDLAKKAGGFGEIKVNLNWSRAKRSGLFGSGKAVDLDVGCLFELSDGSKSVVQALGNRFGRFNDSPFIELAADDRSGASTDGEWLRINGSHWDKIRRVLVFAFIYEGVPNWAATDGVATVFVPGSGPIEVRLDGGGRQGMCAIALIENAGGELRVGRRVEYFDGHGDMDKAFGFGLRWGAGSKN